MEIKPWITAARLHTLPLTVSNIFLGTMIACSQGKFRLNIFLLGLATAILLQVLSNYANDYGDFVSKADQKRVSKFERSLQSGKITPKQMRRMLAFIALLTLITGISLIASAGLSVGTITVFLSTGILCIVAAFTYTMGKKPYGYSGFGDIAVFIFFGIVAVCGIYVLHTREWDWRILLPATTFGLFSTGVLNINNLRDIESDRLSGKSSLIVKIGIEKGKIYHTCLILVALILGIVSSLLDYHSIFQFIYLLTFPFFIRNIRKVSGFNQSSMLDNELRNLSLTIFFYSLTYGIGLML
ncbi:MAG TPA: 1,4-dihydroxy-2-naphthoate octaprenyltransferase [Bacteroidales bacterium]|nr:1,4-dihydroxy-2-naphthoate octaprenyltransferase [Bacteroidales bacterium]